MTGAGRVRVAARVLLQQLADRPLRLAVSVAAIALGIALTAGIWFLNATALAEFSHAARSLAGGADLVIDGGRQGFDESLYPVLAARAEVEAASPVVAVDLALAAGGTLAVQGIDVFAAGRLRPALYADLVRYFTALTAPDAIVLSAATARALGLASGATLPAWVGGERLRLHVVGVLAESAYAGPGGIMDIGSAQWTLARLGRVSRVELKLVPGADATKLARALALPAGALATLPPALEDRAAALTRAYRVNLNMLGLVALLTGAFLVFATQALGTLRRRAQFALLRALGVTRGELGMAVLLEGALVGAIGGIVGVALGWLAAHFVLARFGGDLGAGAPLTAAPAVAVTPLAVAAFVALGITVAVAGSWLPARRLAALAPATALKGATAGFAFADRRGAWAGPPLMLLGAALAFVPPVRGLPLGGYAAIALVLFGAVLLVPTVTRLVVALPVGERPFARLARERLRGDVAESAISIAAIVVSFSLMVAMAIMVHSFRDSFERWLGDVLPADLFLRAPPETDSTFLTPAACTRLAALPGVDHGTCSRQLPLTLVPERPPVTLIARPLGPRELAHLPWVRRGPATADVPLVYVSEAMTDLYGYAPGARVTLPLGGQPRAVVVGGVWRDYARSNGTVLVDRDTYIRWTGDRLATDAALWLAPGVAPADVVPRVRAVPEVSAVMQVADAGTIRERSLAAFDRAFAITYALEAIAVAIGLAGIGFAFASQALARRAEFGLLRHVGCSRRELARLLAGEGAALGALGATYGLLVGTVLSLVLVYVVNRQSFHWSVGFVVPFAPLALAALGVVAAAALTARLVSGEALGGSAVRAVREDW